MRKLITALLVAAPLMLLCSTGRSETTNASLTFYFVSKQKIDGGVLFDAFPFPKLGYISSKPDLTITNLKAVTIEEKSDQAGWVLDKATGTSRPTTIHQAPRLFFTLLGEDEARLRALAERAAAQRFLVLFKEKPLTLAGVADLAEHTDFELYVAQNSRNEEQLRETAEDLKKSLHKSTH